MSSNRTLSPTAIGVWSSVGKTTISIHSQVKCLCSSQRYFLLPLHDIWVDMLIFDPFPPQYCDVHWSWNCWCVKKFYINQCMNIIRSGLSVKETEVEDIEEYTRTLSLASIRLSTDPGCPACLWHWTWQSRKNKEKRKTERQTCPLDLSNKFIAFFFNQVCLCLN